MIPRNRALSSYLQLFRPVQWLKNLMLYFPPFLGGSLAVVLRPEALLPFMAFSLCSSATYIANDILDRGNDSHHPKKKHRPISSGQVSVAAAGCIGAITLVTGMAIALYVSVHLLLWIVLYLAVSLSYSLKLKQIVLLDIFCISAGFLIRLQAGGVVFGVEISEWLFLCVFLLALFLSAGKRLSEKRQLGEDAHYHRMSLTTYPHGFLEGVMLLTGGSVLVTYAMYVLSRHSQLLLYSVPLCCFGLLRYSLRVQTGSGSGDPTESLTHDIPLLITGIVWSGMVGWGIYG